MLGGYDQNGDPTQAVTTTTVTALHQSCHVQSLGARLMKAISRAEQSTVWQRITDVPVTDSTCTTLCGQLLAVGGTDSKKKNTTAVHQYNRSTDSWEVTGDIPKVCSLPLVTVLPGNKLIVGCQGDVYIASVP